MFKKTSITANKRLCASTPCCCSNSTLAYFHLPSLLGTFLSSTCILSHLFNPGLVLLSLHLWRLTYFLHWEWTVNWPERNRHFALRLFIYFPVSPASLVGWVNEFWITLQMREASSEAWQPRATILVRKAMGFTGSMVNFCSSDSFSSSGKEKPFLLLFLDLFYTQAASKW